MKLLFILAFEFATFTFVTGQTDCPYEVSEPTLRDLSAQLATFGLHVYKNASALTPTDNIFFSPASISMVLALVLAGARGKTAEQIKEHLAPSLDIEANLHGAFLALLQQLNLPEKAYALDTANAIYTEQSYNVTNDYMSLIKGCYKAEADAVDFKNDADGVRQKVNAWVEDKTRQKIKDLLPEGSVDRSTRLVLVNALYFKSLWETPFDGNKTKQRSFHSSEAENLEVDMMHIYGEKFQYFEDDSIQVLGLPYKKDELTMYIFLPTGRENDNLTDFERGLDAKKLQDLIKNTHKRKLAEVAIPKWKLTKELTLKGILKNLGMTEMFEDADLSGISGNRDLKVSEAFHKAFVEVNEEGTEAAAGSGIIIVAVSASLPVIEIRFIADHPFFYLIQHNASGVPLFMGRISNPKSTESEH